MTARYGPRLLGALATLLCAAMLLVWAGLEAPARAGDELQVAQARHRVAPSYPPLATDCTRARAGNRDAAYRVARRFLFGMGVRRNRALGAAWLRAAARGGHAEAARLVKALPRNLGRFAPRCGGRGGGAIPDLRSLEPPDELVTLAKTIGTELSVAPKLILAVMAVESRYRVNALSPKKAAGLMQLIPATARRFGVADVWDAAQNIRGGARYLRWLLAYFQGNVDWVLAAYNAGENAVDRYGGIPPYPETQRYVRLVRQLYAARTHPFDASVATPSALTQRSAGADKTD